MSSEQDVARSSSRWFDFEFLFALFLSTFLMVALVVLWRTMLPIYGDYEIDLPQLTLITLNPTTIGLLGLLPALVLLKEFSDIGRWKSRIDAVITYLCLALGLITAIAVFFPFVTIINSLDG